MMLMGSGIRRHLSAFVQSAKEHNPFERTHDISISQHPKNDQTMGIEK